MFGLTIQSSVQEMTALSASHQYDVFLSYASADHAEADLIASALRAADLKVFFDKKSIIPGQLWTEAILAALRSCDTMVFLLTSHSATSPYVQQELGAALITEKQIVPILWEKFYELPGWTRDFQWLDLREIEAEQKILALGPLVEVLAQRKQERIARKISDVKKELALDYLAMNPVSGPFLALYKATKKLSQQK